MRDVTVVKTTSEDDADASSTSVAKRFVRQENFIKVEVKVTYPQTEEDGERLVNLARGFIRGLMFPKGDENQMDAFVESETEEIKEG